METKAVDRSREMDETSWWDLWNSSYRTKEHNDGVSGELFTRTAAVVNSLTENENSRVLEVACGTGILSRMLICSSYHGLDLSPAAIAIARQKATQISETKMPSRLAYETADFCEWNLHPQKFDMAVCIDAIPSIRHQALAMKKMAQSLRKGGHLVVTATNRFVYERIRRTSTVRLENGPVSRWLFRRELNGLVEQAGLTIKRSETIMPRGNVGFLRIVNSPRLNGAFGPRIAALIKRLKERVGLGQYSLVVAQRQS